MDGDQGIHDPKDSPLALPKNPSGAAQMRILIESSAWKLPTFQILLELVMHFRCRFDWDVGSRKTIVEILEEKKDTFDELATATVRYVNEHYYPHVDNPQAEQFVGSAKKRRSGFEFLLEDFPEVMSFCRNLTSLVLWDRAVHLMPSKMIPLEWAPDDFEPMYHDVTDLMGEEYKAMRNLQKTHYWWSGDQFERLYGQNSMVDFVIKICEDMKSGEQITELMPEFDTGLEGILRGCDTTTMTYTPHCRNFIAFHLRNLKPYWIPFLEFILALQRTVKFYTSSQFNTWLRNSQKR